MNPPIMTVKLHFNSWVKRVTYAHINRKEDKDFLRELKEIKHSLLHEVPKLEMQQRIKR